MMSHIYLIKESSLCLNEEKIPCVASRGKMAAGELQRVVNYLYENSDLN